jgi:hypothetical protein
MAGRGYLWFLEEQEGSHAYQRFYDDVQSSLAKTAYRALVGFVIDMRLWPEAKEVCHGLKPFDASWQANPQPHWQHYREITGKALAVYSNQGQDYFQWVIDGDQHTIALPLKAIVSERSTGFPKVAYAIEQYVQGYVQWLDAFASWIEGDRQALIQLMPQLRVENFSAHIYQEVKNLVTLCQESNDTKASLNKHLKTLTLTMARSMIEEVPGRCKPPYHYPLEWGTPSALLRRDHVLVRTYRTLKEVYPGMVVRSILEALQDEEVVNQ